MFQQFGQFGNVAKDSSDALMQSVGAVSRGLQAMAAESVDYAKRSFEQGSATAEKLVGARSFDRAVEIQGEFARSSYEGMMAQATKVGEIVQTTVREAAAPLGGLVQRAAPTA